MTDTRDKNLYAALKGLSQAVTLYLGALDAEMTMKESPNRGRNIAKLSNSLDMANDRVRYFNLGIDFRNDHKEDEYAKILAENPLWPKLTGNGVSIEER